MEGKGTDAGRQGYVTGYVGWKARELMQDDRGRGALAWRLEANRGGSVRH